MSFKIYDTCRISGSKNLVNFFSFETALAGGFLKSESEFKDEVIYPLTLSYCPDSYLVQVNEVMKEEVLFNKYFYKTGTIKTLVDHFSNFSQKILSDFSTKSSILEIGCNDFTFLKNFISTPFTIIIGVDPSDISKENATTSISLYNTFFSTAISEQIINEQGKIDLITTSNSFAHIENIQDVTQGIKNLLAKEGSLIIEVHWLGSLIKNIQFPFIYHEHMYYYSLRSLSFLLNKYGLEVYNAEHISNHGGSIRFYCGHTDEHKIKDSVESLEKEEIALGLYNSATFLEFSKKVARIRIKTMDYLQTLIDQDKKIYGYGASGQANTLMAYYGIEKKHIQLIVDDSPLKIGCFTPKNHIPIVSSTIIKDAPPEYIFCFAYTFFEEISKKTQTDATWIIPLPELKIIHK